MILPQTSGERLHIRSLPLEPCLAAHFVGGRALAQILLVAYQPAQLVYLALELKARILGATPLAVEFFKSRLALGEPERRFGLLGGQPLYRGARLVRRACLCLGIGSERAYLFLRQCSHGVCRLYVLARFGYLYRKRGSLA